MRLTVKIPYELHHASVEECKQFAVPFGTVKLLDSDGDVMLLADSEQSAKDKLHDILTDAGLSGFEYETE